MQDVNRLTTTPSAVKIPLVITKYSYNCDRDNIIFLLSDDHGNTFETTAAQIALDDSIITSLPKKDIFLIGYVAGMEHADLNHFDL